MGPHNLCIRAPMAAEPTHIEHDTNRGTLSVNVVSDAGNWPELEYTYTDPDTNVAYRAELSAETMDEIYGPWARMPMHVHEMGTCMVKMDVNDTAATAHFTVPMLGLVTQFNITLLRVEPTSDDPTVAALIHDNKIMRARIRALEVEKPALSWLSRLMPGCW